MTALSDLRTAVAQDLRDPTNATWTVTELDALINRGIDALADVYPKEIVSTFATVTQGTYSYATTLMSIYRIDIYTSAGSYRETVLRGTSDHPDAGWELHGGTLYLPVGMTLTTGDRLRAFGYGRYIHLVAATATTDVDESGQWAVRTFCQASALAALRADRAAFQQWQENSNNTDVSAIALAQLLGQARSDWESERRRLRRLRK